MAAMDPEIPKTMTALTTGQRWVFTRMYNGITRREIGHGMRITKDHPVPSIKDNELLVKVRAVALNPTDWKHADIIGAPNAILGCDFAGEVAKVGEKATGDWKVGDRIASGVHGGMYKDKGSYAQYLKVPFDLAWHVPEDISDTDAATYGVSGATSMQAIYHSLDVPWPDEEATEKTPKTILIYAGSTTAGLMALQMVAHAGLTAVTTCSPHSYDLVKSYGAAASYDYRSSTAADEIKKAYPDISRAMDCYSEGNSLNFCHKVMKDNGGKVVTLLPQGKSKVANIENINLLAYTLFGEPFAFFAPLGPKFPAVPEDRAALVRFLKLLPDVIKWLKHTPVEVLPGGFEAIPEGLDRLRKKSVSGKKLCVKIV